MNDAHHDRPTLGAALPISALAEYRDWLLDAQRDLEIQDPSLPAVLDGDWRPRVRQARDMLDGYTGRLGMHGPFDGLPLLSRDPKVRQVVSDRLCQALEFGAELGTTHMVIHSPFLSFGHPQVVHGPTTRREEETALVHDVLSRPLEMAQQSGCTLVMENIVDTNPEPLRALVQSFESAHVRMSLDTGHAFITHRIGGPPPDQWVRADGPLLGHVHLQDTDGNLDRHWCIGDGVINWYALFEALGELDHAPRLILELRDKSHIRRAAEYLVERGLAR